MADIKWTIQEKPLKELIPNTKNPRKLSKEQAQHLETSLSKFGLCEPIVVNTNNNIIGGHQRVKTLKKMKHKTAQVLVASKELTNEEVDELAIRLNKNTGEWDWDILANEWEMKELIEWGFDVDEFLGFEEDISLPDGEKGIEKISFTVTKEQKENIEQALKIAKKLGSFPDMGNENNNGNAINRIAEFYCSHEKKLI